MKKLTLEEIYSKVRADYDIESILAPYKEGGTESQPIERSSGTILDWLINKKKFPADVAGAALISVAMELRGGKSFSGDGSYGSKGNDLVQYIAQRCDFYNKAKLKTVMFETIAFTKIEALDEWVFESVRKALPWFVRWIAPGTWRWLRKRRVRRRVESS